MTPVALLVAAFLGGDAAYGLPPNATQETDPLAPEAWDELARVARDELTSRAIPGAAVAVVKDDRVVFLKGFGVASVESGLEVTPDTLFQIGSVTKTLTAALLVRSRKTAASTWTSRWVAT